MNGSCAGGTGAFIDQMATLLGITADELDELSLHAQKVYPIASRCGVFAKSDIQPLLNQGARREDIAASIFQAVVDQTVSGLAQGRTIEGKVLFLGGPLFFLKGLRHAFVKTLGLDSDHAVFPDEAPVFVAYGCAIYAATAEDSYTIDDIIDKIINAKASDNIVTGEPLFKSQEEYDEFIERHKKFDLGYADIRTYSGDAYLGIDAGSTTTKLVLITDDGRILYHHYSSNQGQPLDKIAAQVKQLGARVLCCRYAVGLAKGRAVVKDKAVECFGHKYERDHPDIHEPVYFQHLPPPALHHDKQYYQRGRSQQHECSSRYYHDLTQRERQERCRAPEGIHPDREDIRPVPVAEAL